MNALKFTLYKDNNSREDDIYNYEISSKYKYSLQEDKIGFNILLQQLLSGANQEQTDCLKEILIEEINCMNEEDFEELDLMDCKKNKDININELEEKFVLQIPKMEADSLEGFIKTYNKSKFKIKSTTTNHDILYAIIIYLRLICKNTTDTIKNDLKNFILNYDVDSISFNSVDILEPNEM